MIDLTTITTPFGLLDAETQAALKAHGGPYEWYSQAGWNDDPSARYTFEARTLCVRVKPAPPKPREKWLRINHNGDVRECAEDAEDATLWREVLP